MAVPDVNKIPKIYDPQTITSINGSERSVRSVFHFHVHNLDKGA